LISNAMMLSEKTTALKTVQKQLSNAKVKKEVSGLVAQEVDVQIKMHLNDELEWSSFRHSFEKVYPDFFSRLKRLYPICSEYELHLCAFIRAGMENRQIAHMLNIQPESIKKARQRLRKKLNLNPLDSLENFLRTQELNSHL
ncbi:MAG: hypothetical protein QM751_09120, partial [Paludibacteraceae bacterium]